MSHHLDSPVARQDVRLDITDLYAFRGQTGTVFVINVCHSLGNAKIPGYHPEGMYEFKVDINGDAVEDVTYRLTFDERDEQGKQRYSIRRIRGAQAVDPHAAGTVVAKGATDEPVATPSGVRAWAGHAGDPFWIEPTVFHAVGHAFQDGTAVDLAGWDPGKAKNFLPVRLCMQSCWNCPTANCSQMQAASAGSVCGQWPRSPRMQGDGARSTVSVFR